MHIARMCERLPRLHGYKSNSEFLSTTKSGKSWIKIRFWVRRKEDTLNLLNPRVKKKTRFAREDNGLCPFYGSTVKEWLVYEVILLNKILRNHLHSENMRWNFASFNVTLNYFKHKIMEFCVISSFALDNWEPKDCQTLGNKQNHSHLVLRGRIFSKEKVQII